MLAEGNRPLQILIKSNNFFGVQHLATHIRSIGILQFSKPLVRTNPKILYHKLGILKHLINYQGQYQEGQFRHLIVLWTYGSKQSTTIYGLLEVDCNAELG